MEHSSIYLHVENKHFFRHNIMKQVEFYVTKEFKITLNKCLYKTTASNKYLYCIGITVIIAVYVL